MGQRKNKLYFHTKIANIPSKMTTLGARENGQNLLFFRADGQLYRRLPLRTEKPPSHLTQQFSLSYMNFSIAIIFSLSPFWPSILHKNSLFTRSKACLKSTNVTKSFHRLVKHHSIILSRISKRLTLSTVKYPFLKPAYSSTSLASTPPSEVKHLQHGEKLYSIYLSNRGFVNCQDLNNSPSHVEEK